MTKKLEQNVDQALLDKIKNGDETARYALLIRYHGLSVIAATEFCYSHGLPNSYIDDYISIYFEYVNHAIDRYDASKGNFYAFWRKLAAYMSMKEYRETHQNELLTANDFEDYHFRLLKDYETEKERSNSVEMIAEMIKKNKKKFNKSEYAVLQLFLKGFDGDEICDMAFISRSTFYRIRKSINKKIHSIIIKNK